jgi:hypothetical protein
MVGQLSPYELIALLHIVDPSGNGSYAEIDIAGNESGIIPGLLSREWESSVRT